MMRTAVLKGLLAAPLAVAKTLAVILTVSSFAPLAQADPLFTVSVGPGSGSGCAVNEGISRSPIPVSVGHVCSANSSVVGSAAADASANFGSVGAGTSSATSSGSSVPLQDNALAQFSDRLVFSKTDSSAPNLFPVSLNLAFAGVVNTVQGLGLAGANADVRVSFLGLGFTAFFAIQDGSGFLVSNPQGIGITGTIAPGAGGFSVMLTTPTVLASVLNPVLLELNLSTSVFTSGSGASATADFFHTLEFPIGIDVFNLPTGYTVNAGSYLVNNRFIDESVITPSIPEPGTYALMLAGLGVLGYIARRRKGQG